MTKYKNRELSTKQELPKQKPKYLVHSKSKSYAKSYYAQQSPTQYKLFGLQ